MVQLDGLRALAILAVFVSHFGGSHSLFARLLPWGTLGVRLFFVLSGFLITGILLQCREYRDQGLETSRSVLRSFYVRRFLRIFPIYYATVLAVTLVNIRPMRDAIGWNLTYTSNFYWAVHDYQGTGSHFWSLAVEEQFYLIWPWLIFCVPRHRLLAVNLLLIVSGVGFRGLGMIFGWNDFALQILPLGCLDTLGIGSLAAILTQGGRVGSAKSCRWVRISLWSGLLLMVFRAFAGGFAWGRRLWVVLDVSGMELVFGPLVVYAAKGFRGVGGRILAARPLVYIGKISYGMYVYHGFMPAVCQHAFKLAGLSVFYWRFDGWLNSAISITLAAASWHFFESPINRLKERFRYTPVPGLKANAVLAPGR
jgi:peptidoglycan/LPS O-acetylase OafA/YrhL